MVQEEGNEAFIPVILPFPSLMHSRFKTEYPAWLRYNSDCIQTHVNTPLEGNQESLKVSGGENIG